MNRRFIPLALATSFAALAILAACSDDSNSNNNPQITADVSINPNAQTLGFGAFSPDTFTAALNGGASVKVVWRNDDNSVSGGVAHTVTDTTAAAAFSVPLNAFGDTTSVTFTTAGEYPYKCSIHDTMRGLVIVTP